jgi:RNA-splicing ligase RtcB
MEHHTVITNPEGKQAIIYLKDELIEDSAKVQLLQVMSNESVSNIRLAPDLHVGYGCLIGFTAKVEVNKINPNFIGNDIACGILLFPLGHKKIDEYKIEKRIKNIIPMGNDNATGTHKEIPCGSEYFARYLERANIKLKEFYEKFTPSEI